MNKIQKNNSPSCFLHPSSWHRAAVFTVSTVTPQPEDQKHLHIPLFLFWLGSPAHWLFSQTHKQREPERERETQRVCVRERERSFTRTTVCLLKPTAASTSRMGWTGFLKLHGSIERTACSLTHGHTHGCKLTHGHTHWCKHMNLPSIEVTAVQFLESLGPFTLRFWEKQRLKKTCLKQFTLIVWVQALV